MLVRLGRFFVRFWRYVLVGAVACLVVGYVILGTSNSTGAILQVTSGDFTKTVHISGTVIPAKEVKLGFATNGRIARTYGVVGQYVEQGSILAEIENGDLIASVAQKRAALVEAEARLESLKIGTRKEELDTALASVTSARAALVNAIQSAYTTADDAIHNKVDQLFENPRIQPKFSLSIADANLKNMLVTERMTIESLLSTWATDIAQLTNTNAAEKAVTAQARLTQIASFLARINTALNQAVPDAGTSTATLTAFTTTVTTARSNVNTAASALTISDSARTAAEHTLAVLKAGSTSEAIAAQVAAVAAAEADVENAQAALYKTRIVAPFSGLVTRMDAKVGEIVSPSTSDIAMQSSGISQIETFIPEVTIAGVAPGNSAVVTFDAYGPSVVFFAKVIAVDPAETVKDGVPTYKTTLTFLESDKRIRSGMTVNVVITTGVLHDAIVIPSGAVGTMDGTRYVSVVKDTEVFPQRVETGPSPALGQIQILSGLTAGETILLTPLVPSDKLP